MRKNADGYSVADVEVGGKETTVAFGPVVKMLCGVLMAQRATEIAGGGIEMASALVDSPLGNLLAQEIAMTTVGMIARLKLHHICPYPDDDEAIAKDILGEMGRGVDGKLLDVAPGICPDCGGNHG